MNENGQEWAAMAGFDDDLQNSCITSCITNQRAELPLVLHSPPISLTIILMVMLLTKTVTSSLNVLFFRLLTNVAVMEDL